jgi:leucine dehydrogenase
MPGEGGAGDLAGATMLGAFAGIAAALRRLDGEEDWARRTVVVQGLGEVGHRLSERLIRHGARVIATDVDEVRAQRARGDLGIELRDPGCEYDVPCDVFAPCAMGGVLHDLTVQRLRCRAVVGAANNILARSVHGLRLHARRILYVPEVIVNAGAVIRGAAYHLHGAPAPDAEVEGRIRALAEHLPPSQVVAEEAARRIQARRVEPVQA